jgi:predicted ATPase
MLHLKSISLRPFPPSEKSRFPFNLPILNSFDGLTFSSAVTFLVGENGSGKSTLLEALACAAGSITVGSESLKTDPSVQTVRQFSNYLHLSWGRQTHKGFFLRAEDFFGYARKLSQMRQEMEEDLKTIDKEYAGRSPLAKSLAKMPASRELYDMKLRYDGDLGAHSHGESFLTLFQSRFVPNGLYLLDEPEAPLSPLRQLAFLSMLKEMVDQESQFIIATHSPILMAYPGADLFNFDNNCIKPAAYAELDHVKLTKAFLNDPATYLNHLL